jgi:methyl acetate hydrolase
MNRMTAGIVFSIGVGAAALAGTASAQNSPGSAALDAGLRGAVERKDVPGVVALVTDRERVLYQGAFGVADVATGRPLTSDAPFSHRLDDQAGHLGGLDAIGRTGPHRSR